MAKQKRKGDKSKRRHGNRDYDDANDDVALEDDRFRAAETRPQFQKVKQQTSKVVLDDRFASVLTDPRFQLEGRDKYGRKKKSKSNTAKEELSAFYTVEKERDANNSDDDDGKDDDDASSTSGSSASSDEGSGDDGKHKTSEAGKGKSKDERKDVSSDDDAPDKPEDPKSRIAYLTAFSRGELDVSSSSDDDSVNSSDDSVDDDESVDGEDPVYGTAGVLDPSNKEDDEVDITDAESPYLVVCNVDWQHLRAVDLYSILSSFSPQGAVKHVQVYTSDFGMEQLEKEKTYGPAGIWKKSKKPNPEDDDEDNSSADGSKQSNGDTSSSDDDDSVNSDMDQADMEQRILDDINRENAKQNSDFDREKLRAYEASKLKYYFAIVEFNSAQSADVAYQELDGMEFEHSSSKMDMRCIESKDVVDVIQGRPLRDEARSIPSTYDPPEFVVSALQQTNVQCTWDTGDTNRQKALTKYRSGGWDEDEEAALRIYMASDNSSDDSEEEDQDNDSDSDDSDDDGAMGDSGDAKRSNGLSSKKKKKIKGKQKKGSRMRKLLGLIDSSDDEDGGSDDDDDKEANGSSDDEDSSDDDEGIAGRRTGSKGGDYDDDVDDEEAADAERLRAELMASDDDDDSDGDVDMQMKFIPGKKSLEEKIRSKLEGSKEKPKELTPWEKYQEKRKQKRKELRQAARNKRKDRIVKDSDSDMQSDGDANGGDNNEDDDDFFAHSDGEDEAAYAKQRKEKQQQEKERKQEVVRDQRKSKAQLELLLAGEEEEENIRDYNMRGIQRIDKNKDKKLRGARKRKEAKMAKSVVGTEFEINTTDSRFSAVLEGGDDRFGIDKTATQYKETPAMRAILKEQSKRRKEKKKRKKREAATNEESSTPAGADAASPGKIKNKRARMDDAIGGDTKRAAKSGKGADLSLLVSRLKHKVGGKRSDQ